MISLLLAIICASFMYLVFKFAGIRNVQTFPIIVVNYFTCVILSGIIWKDDFVAYFEKSSPYLFITTTFTGICFISAFYLMAIATRKLGVATSTTISRMSMIFPTIVTVLFFKEKFNVFTIIGFLLSMVVIYFIVVKGGSQGKSAESEEKKSNDVLLMLGLFIGFGVCDILNKSITKIFFGGKFQPLMMFFIYGSALIVAICVLIYNAFQRKRNLSMGIIHEKNTMKFTRMSFGLGIFLGTVNLASLFFFLKAITDKSITGPAVFSINSIGILSFSTILSMLVFRERLNQWKWIGIGLAIVAIVFLNIK